MISRTKSRSSLVAYRNIRSRPALSVITEFLNLCYDVRFQASGSSMYPTIREGEFITVQPLGPSHVKFGDVILYHAGGALIAHRVVGRQMGGDNILFLMRGDASGSCDAPVDFRQVLGKVTSVERNGRTIRLDGKMSKAFSILRTSASRMRRWAYRKARPMEFRHSK